MVTQSLAVQCHNIKASHGSVKVHLYSLITCLEMTVSKNKQIGKEKAHSTGSCISVKYRSDLKRSKLMELR